MPLRQIWSVLRAACIATLTVCFVAEVASAQSLLLGPAARRIKPRIELDPRLPSGALRRESLALRRETSVFPGESPAIRRETLALPRQGQPLHASNELACSLSLPLCVAGHLPMAPSAIAALEGAYRRLVYAAGLPAPIRDWDPAFGSPAVTWAMSRDDQPLRSELIPTHYAAFESAALVCRSGVLDASDAQLERDAHLCIGEAIAARLDAAESPRSRRAFAQTLWWELGRPSDTDRQELILANARAYRAAVGREEVSDAASTALLFEYLEQSLGTPAPLHLLAGLFAVSGQPKQSGTLRYPNEPDWLDVIRESLGDDRVDFAHRINAFGAARVQLGSPEGPLGKLAWAGDAARVEPDWDIAVSSLPRRVASRKPIEPLGLVLIRLKLDVPTKDLSLAIQVEWEPPVPFAWTAVKLDEQQREIGRIDLAFEPRVTRAEKRIVALDGTRTILIVGTNLGGIDATHLLDPDHAPFEPHGCTIYVVRL